MVAIKILILLITLLFMTSLNSFAQRMTEEEYEAMKLRVFGPPPPPTYKDKIEIMGQPLDKKMQYFLLNKLWCYTMIGGGEPDVHIKFTKLKRNVYIQEYASLPLGVFGNPTESNVIITMLNDKEFVIMSIRKFNTDYSGDIPKTYPDEEIYQVVNRILNENQYRAIKRITATKENNRWAVKDNSHSGTIKTICD